MTEHDHTSESVVAPKRHPGQVERSATRAGIQAGFSRAEVPEFGMVRIHVACEVAYKRLTLAASLQGY